MPTGSDWTRPRRGWALGLTEDAHRVRLDTSSQGVALGLFTVSHPPLPPRARPPGLGNTAPSEHASPWWEALQRAPL